MYVSPYIRNAAMLDIFLTLSVILLPIELLNIFFPIILFLSAITVILLFLRGPETIKALMKSQPYIYRKDYVLYDRLSDLVFVAVAVVMGYTLFAMIYSILSTGRHIVLYSHKGTIHE